MDRKSIVWFRSDLRLHDNEALTEAARACDEIMGVYVFDPQVFSSQTKFGFPKTGRHRARFIIESVQALREGFRTLGAELIVRTGRPEDIIFELARQHKTSWVFCNRERTREEIEVQDALERRLWSIGQEIRYERGKMLLYTQDLPFPITHTPDSFSVFKKETEHFVEIRKPLPVPAFSQMSTNIDPGEIPTLADFGHDPAITTFSGLFAGGESTGLEILQQIAVEPSEQAGWSGLSAISPLSPWVSQGCLSPKLIYDRLVGKTFLDASNVIINSLLWRDYFRLMGKKYKDLIFQRGGIINDSRNVGKSDLSEAKKWLQADTGVDLIDACLTQLRQTGYLVHRGRSLVANYLIHEMQVNWQIGAEYFESLLLDYDPCSNYGNWNQIAGVGADRQKDRVPGWSSLAQKLDPSGDYIKKWLPLNEPLQKL